MPFPLNNHKAIGWNIKQQAKEIDIVTKEGWALEANKIIAINQMIFIFLIFWDW